MPSTRSLIAGGLAGALWLAMLLLGGVGWTADIGVLEYFYARDRPALAAASVVLTQLGGWIVLTILTAAAAAWLFLRTSTRRAFLLLAIVLGGRAMVELQKYICARARPDELERLVGVHSLSFPSGHSANSMIVYLAIAILVVEKRQAVAAALVLSILIGLSRLVLGVHWPSDVIGGWVFGLLWTLALIRLAERKGTARPLPH